MGLQKFCKKPSPDSQLRALVIEDDLIFRDSLLGFCRFTVPQIKWVGIPSGDQVAAYVAALSPEAGNPYDLVIVDYQLSGKITGADLWHVCRTKYPAIPFILISGHPLEQIAEAAERERIRASFLEKPFHPEEFKALLLQTVESIVAAKVNEGRWASSVARAA